MTLPVELLQRRRGREQHDVAVVGAGVAGLVCAATLARAGLRVVLIERAKRPGGSVQTVAHQGFAVDLELPLWQAGGLREALAEAGARDLELADVRARDDLRVGVLAAGAMREPPLRLPVPGSVPSPSILDAVRSLYGIPPRTFAALGGLYQELAKASGEQVEGWQGTYLTDWLEERTVDRVVAAALRRSLVLLLGMDPDRLPMDVVATSARMLAPDSPPCWIAPADNPIAGMRAVVQSLVDAFIDAGGDLRLGTRVVGFHLEKGRARGLAVQREEQPFLDDLVTEKVVLAVAAPEAATLLGGAVGPGPAAATTACLSMAFAIAGMPSELVGGDALRVLRLVAPAAAEQRPEPGTPPGPITLVCPTAWAPRIAPPGQALLLAEVALGEEGPLDMAEVGRVSALARAAVMDLTGASPEVLLWDRAWLRRDPRPSTLLTPGAGSLPAGVVVPASLPRRPGELSRGPTAGVMAGRAAAEQILSPGGRAAPADPPGRARPV